MNSKYAKEANLIQVSYYPIGLFENARLALEHRVGLVDTDQMFESNC